LQKENFEKDFEQKSAELDETIRQFDLSHSTDRLRLDREHPPSVRDQALQFLNITIPSHVEEFEIIGTPYTVGPPVKPENFIGRGAELGQIFFRLQSAQMMSSSIIGLQKTGKTSLLYYLTDPAIKVQKMGLNAGRTIICYMNMQEEINTPQVFYRKMLSSVIRAVSLQRGGPLDHLAPGDVNRGDVDIFLDECQQKRLNIVFMVDEFDLVLRGQFDVSFLEGIRAWQGRTNVAWIFASHKRLETIGQAVGVPAGSPYYNIFVPPPIILGSLTDEEARQLILHPTRDSNNDFSNPEVDDLIYIAGRMPYLLQNTAAMAFQARSSELSFEEMKIVDRLVVALDSYFTHIWEKQITQNERQLLERILSRKSVLSNGQSLAQLEFLISSGLVDVESDQLSISGEVLKTWISRRLQESSKNTPLGRRRK
jgi:hypothetical protein